MLEVGLDGVTAAVERHLAVLGAVGETLLELGLAPVAHVAVQGEGEPGGGALRAVVVVTPPEVSVEVDRFSCSQQRAICSALAATPVASTTTRSTCAG